MSSQARTVELSVVFWTDGHVTRTVESAKTTPEALQCSDSVQHACSLSAATIGKGRSTLVGLC